MAACTGNDKTPQNGNSTGQNGNATQSGGSENQSDQTEKFMVKLADGTEKEAVFANEFYSFATSKLVTIKELAYQQNKPETGFAQLKLVLDGNSENTIAFMLKKSVPHGDYAVAWENAEYTAYADVLTEDGLFGVNCEWEMPDNLSEYEIRVFDNKTADSPIEIGFIIFE